MSLGGAVCRVLTRRWAEGASSTGTRKADGRESAPAVDGRLLKLRGSFCKYEPCDVTLVRWFIVLAGVADDGLNPCGASRLKEISDWSFSLRDIGADGGRWSSCIEENAVSPVREDGGGTWMRLSAEGELDGRVRKMSVLLSAVSLSDGPVGAAGPHSSGITSLRTVCVGTAATGSIDLEPGLSAVASDFTRKSSSEITRRQVGQLPQMESH